MAGLVVEAISDLGISGGAGLESEAEHDGGMFFEAHKLSKQLYKRRRREQDIPMETLMVVTTTLETGALVARSTCRSVRHSPARVMRVPLT